MATRTLAGGLDMLGAFPVNALDTFGRQPFGEEQMLAARKAKALLVQYLDHKQRAMYYKFGHFYVRGKSGKEYRVGPGQTELRCTDKQWCVGSYEVPTPDSLLALKLNLEEDDEKVVKAANSYGAMPAPVFGNALDFRNPEINNAPC